MSLVWFVNFSNKLNLKKVNPGRAFERVIIFNENVHIYNFNYKKGI